MSYFTHQIMEKDRRNFKLKYLLSLPCNTYHVLEKVGISLSHSTIELTLMRESLTGYMVCVCPGLYGFMPGRITAAQSWTSSVMWITEIHLDTQGATASSKSIQQKKHHLLRKHFQLQRATAPFKGRTISLRSILPIQQFSDFLISSSKLLECFVCHFYSRCLRVLPYPGSKK